MAPRESEKEGAPWYGWYRIHRSTAYKSFMKCMSRVAHLGDNLGLGLDS